MKSLGLTPILSVMEVIVLIPGLFILSVDLYNSIYGDYPIYSTATKIQTAATISSTVIFALISFYFGVYKELSQRNAGIKIGSILVLFLTSYRILLLLILISLPFFILNTAITIVYLRNMRQITSQTMNGS